MYLSLAVEYGTDSLPKFTPTGRDVVHRRLMKQVEQAGLLVLGCEELMNVTEVEGLWSWRRSRWRKRETVESF